MKQFASSVGAIEQVINYSPGAMRAPRGIGQRYLDRLDRVKKGLRPFFRARLFFCPGENPKEPGRINDSIAFSSRRAIARSWNVI